MSDEDRKTAKSQSKQAIDGDNWVKWEAIGRFLSTLIYIEKNHSAYWMGKIQRHRWR